MCLPPPPGGRDLRFYVLQYSAETVIGFKNLEIIDTLSSREGEEYEGEDHLSIRPSLSGTKEKMTVDTLWKTESIGEVEIEGKTCERGHACFLLFFFVLVREDTLWHNRSTSLVMELVS